MTATIAIEQPSYENTDVIHASLAQTWWATGIPRDLVEKAFRNSVCAIAHKNSDWVAGFARAMTNCAKFGWLTNVFVAPERRGAGLGRALVTAPQAHPDQKGLRRWMLSTLDAHCVYKPCGFGLLPEPGRIMHILNKPIRADKET